MKGMIDLAVDHRRTVGTILNDPVVTRSFSEQDSFRRVMDRIRQVLMGDDVSHQARVSTAMLIAAISGTVMHPLVAGARRQHAAITARTAGSTTSTRHELDAQSS